MLGVTPFQVRGRLTLDIELNAAGIQNDPVIGIRGHLGSSLTEDGIAGSRDMIAAIMGINCWGDEDPRHP